MAIEPWDPQRKRYVLYRSDADHHADCERSPFERIPRRIFLDTNVINLLIKWDTHVFEQEPIPPTMEPTLATDVEALMHVFYVGRRADWDLVASPKTLAELAETADQELRDALLDYGVCLVDSHPESDGRRFAIEFARRLVDSPLIDMLPDRADRELIGHAIGLQCDVFCTCDRRTILNRRHALRHVPLRILTPAEWWGHVKPWAALWC